ncbi:MAG: hypothetical protein AAF125_10275 [Chloroflexota bacterium]
MNKREQIINAIRDYGPDIVWHGDWVSRIAAEVECARSTVYRAIRHLREIEAIDDSGKYVGRCPNTDEIKVLVSEAGGDDIPVLLTDERLSEWARRLNCWADDLGYWFTTQWFRSAFDWPRGGSYGQMIMNRQERA